MTSPEDSSLATGPAGTEEEEEEEEMWRRKTVIWSKASDRPSSAMDPGRKDGPSSLALPTKASSAAATAPSGTGANREKGLHSTLAAPPGLDSTSNLCLRWTRPRKATAQTWSPEEEEETTLPRTAAAPWCSARQNTGEEEEEEEGSTRTEEEIRGEEGDSSELVVGCHLH